VSHINEPFEKLVEKALCQEILYPNSKSAVVKKFQNDNKAMEAKGSGRITKRSSFNGTMPKRRANGSLLAITILRGGILVKATRLG